MFSNLKYLILSLLFLNITAHAEIKYWAIQNPLESGQVEYIVIEEDTSLRSNQNVLSQRLVYKKRGKANDAAILKEVEAVQKPKVHVTFDDPVRSGKPLWVAVKNTWTAQDEKDYSDWFAANVNERFNIGTTLLADCADVGLLFRWAYAHDKKLPVANTLSGSGKLFGHFSGSAAWDKLPSNPTDWRKDERFKQAMRYLFGNTYTRSIIGDLYPTVITPDYVRPGSVYMIIRAETGHTQTIVEINKNNAGMRTLWGNEPSAEAIYKSWFIWEPAVKNMFGMWRWTTYQNGVWKLVSGSKMPGYSEEQHSKRKELGNDDFQTWVLDRLGLVDYVEIKVGRLIQTVYEGIEYRVNSTAQGSMICGLTACDPNGEDYDNYSTTSRDARLFASQDDLFKNINAAGGINNSSVQKAIADAYGLDKPVLAGYSYTFKDFIFDPVLLKNLKAGANMTYNERWGLALPTTADEQIQFYNQWLRINIGQRMGQVRNAIYYCVNQVCDMTMPSIKDLNTAKMDLGFTKLARLISPVVASGQVTATVAQTIADEYRSGDLIGANSTFITSPLCENPTQCTLYDVIWNGDALNRVNTWKSEPTAAPNLRWGL